ncbi:MAG: hypothetical protein DI611_09130 [Brachybacterium faecium]|nr:MAG: hypothetical protein DI611_09130 [Brachybacterium faecium]
MTPRKSPRSRSRSSCVPTLGPLERDVLEAVWSRSAEPANDTDADTDTGTSTGTDTGTGESPRGTVSVKDVHESLLDRGLAYTTISTVLTNLEKKGVLARVTPGRPIRYHATIGRDEYSAALMREALSYSQDRHASILHFVSGMDEADVDTLRSLIERTGGHHPDSPDAAGSNEDPPGPASAGPQEPGPSDPDH